MLGPFPENVLKTRSLETKDQMSYKLLPWRREEPGVDQKDQKLLLNGQTACRIVQFLVVLYDQLGWLFTFYYKGRRIYYYLSYFHFSINVVFFYTLILDP